LEKTGQESEKLIAEARSDKLKQMEEVHAAQKKVSELESRYLNLKLYNHCLLYLLYCNDCIFFCINNLFQNERVGI